MASTLATTGTTGALDGHVRQRLRHHVGGRLHQRAMEGRGHRQQHGALGAFGLGDLDRALDRGLVARDHHLPAAVVVGGLADLALRRFAPRPRRAASNSSPSSAAMAPTPTGTAFCIAWPRMRSSRAVSAMREGAGRGQRRIFAERMAGDELRVARKIEAGFRLQHAHGRERDRHQRRLGVLGERQRLGRPFADDGAELLAERGIDLVEHRPRRRRNASASALPMPTAWLPWPGNTNATAMPALYPVFAVKSGPKDTALRHSVKLSRRR